MKTVFGVKLLVPGSFHSFVIWSENEEKWDWNISESKSPRVWKWGCVVSSKFLLTLILYVCYIQMPKLLVYLKAYILFDT